MPELPEVETVRRGLSKHLLGHTIQQVSVREARLRWPVDAHKLRELVVGARVAGIRRRAKYLLIDMQRDTTLIIHLGMSGSLLLLTEARPVEKHDHVLFHLDHGWELRFRDPRRFGLVDAIRTSEVPRYARFIHLGLEPLSARTKPAALFHKARRSNRPIKNLLMDGTFLVGVGNIYANEALFHAGIHPARPASSLSAADWQRLLEQIRKVLRTAIRKGGTTLNDFVDSNGEAGYFQLSLSVYGRTGQPCVRCDREIQRVVQVGRSTFFCPHCQT